MTAPRPSDARALPARTSGRASAIAPAPATATGTQGNSFFGGGGGVSRGAGTAPQRTNATAAASIVRPREDVGRGPRDTKRAATERKDEAKPCRGLPRRLHPSTTASRAPPTSTQPRSEAVWALAAANNRAAHGVQGRNEGRGAAALGGVRLRLAWDGGASGGWLLVVSVGTTAWGQPSRRLLSLSSESTMGLAERTARGACRENRPQ